MEDCLNKFQAEQEPAVIDSLHMRSISQGNGPTFEFKRLSQFQLLPDFVAKTNTVAVSEIENEPSLQPSDEAQCLHYDNFCSSFRDLLDKKYGHLEEVDLFGDTNAPDRGGITSGDFELILDHVIN